MRAAQVHPEYEHARANPQQDDRLCALGLWLHRSHRFYYGKPVSGTIWFFTAGLLLIGWIIDLFLIPSMARGVPTAAMSLDRKTIRSRGFCSRSWGSSGSTAFTWEVGHRHPLPADAGDIGIRLIYDFWTLNSQISELN